MTVRRFAVVAMIALAGWGQSFAQVVAETGEAPRFEVASIKPSAPDAGGTTMYNPAGGRFAAASITPKGLIAFAYDVRAFQISGGPNWLGSERYDIVAKADGEAGGERLRAMVRSLLTERLGLKLHRESKELPVFAMVIAKGGSKLRPSAAADPQMRGGRGRLTAQKITAEMLAGFLGDRVGRPVLDRTGIAGDFDIQLEWTPETSPEPGVSIFTALQEQLGLRLEAEKGPVEILAIEHVERPSAN